MAPSATHKFGQKLPNRHCVHCLEWAQHVLEHTMVALAPQGGVNDFETAKWLSQTMGQKTIGYQTESRKPGDVPTTGTSITGRDLLTPDEIMQLPPDLQLLRVQGQDWCRKRMAGMAGSRLNSPRTERRFCPHSRRSSAFGVTHCSERQLRPQSGHSFALMVLPRSE